MKFIHELIRIVSFNPFPNIPSFARRCCRLQQRFVCLLKAFRMEYFAQYLEASAVSPAVDAVARAPAQFEALVKLVMEHTGANIFFGDDARRVQNGKPGGGFVPNEEGLD